MSMSRSPANLHRGRVADQIVEDLRRQIVSGELPDGTRLPSERELAAHYDVSAPTIREAIRVLAAIGLLSTRNGSRTTVTARSDTLARDVHRLRRAVREDVRRRGVGGAGRALCLRRGAGRRAGVRPGHRDPAGGRPALRRVHRYGVGVRRAAQLLRDPVRDLVQPTARRAVPVHQPGSDRDSRRTLQGELSEWGRVRDR